MAKKIRTKQSKDVAPAGEDMDCDAEGGDVRMLDFEEEHEVDDAKDAQAEHDKTAKQLRKKARHHEKGKGKGKDEAELERPRKRHKLRSSPGRPRSTTADSSSPPAALPSSSSPEEPTESQTVLDLDPRPHTPTPPPPPPPPSSLQRFPLPSRPRAPEKAELASQGLDRALAGARLVDPLLSTPLPQDEDGNDDVTGLSSRTLRRLKDLGIVELFAGVYRVAFRKLHCCEDVQF
jgi:ATP-dependent RNA helicase DDX51/DBP6